MNWRRFFKLFLRNLVVFTGLSTLLLGGVGYLLSGWVGFYNLATWGFIFGLLGSFSGGLGMVLEANYWGDGNFRNFAEWNWFIKKDDRPDHNGQ